MVGRRKWLKQASLGVAATTVGCGDDAPLPFAPDGGMDAAGSTDSAVDASPTPPVPVPEIPVGFGFGVASGDPLPDAVILWTRYVPTTPAAVEVEYEVAIDPEFTSVVQSGMTAAEASRDWTVKLDITGLDPASTYYYRFKVGEETSLIGRTRTAPIGATDRLRLGVVSCANHAHGYFHVYRRLAERADLDAVVHVGDYIYEYGDAQYGSVRLSDPSHEILTLEDYRKRYQLYRLDPDCQAIHQQHPFISVWDDHETANNSARDSAGNHDPDEGSWEDRKAAAYQAYAEWMPIREQETGKIWRSFQYGDLMHLIMLDTRIWGRDDPPGRANIGDPSLTLLGLDQEEWLGEEIRASTARWRVIGQQVMLGHYQIGGDAINLDQWDGYQAARSRFFDLIATSQNVAVLTGDIHSHWAMELARDPFDPAVYNPVTSDGSLGVEFVTSSVTSPSLGPSLAPSIEMQSLEENVHMRYSNLSQRGFIILDLTQEALRADFFVTDGVLADQGTESFARSFRVPQGQSTLIEEPAPTEARSAASPLAPGIPERSHLT